MSDTEGQDEDRNEIILSNDDDSDSGPPSPKRPNLAKEAKKYGGAKKYKTKFKALAIIAMICITEWFLHIRLPEQK